MYKIYIIPSHPTSSKKKIVKVAIFFILKGIVSVYDLCCEKSKMIFASYKCHIVVWAFTLGLKIALIINGVESCCIDNHKSNYKIKKHAINKKFKRPFFIICHTFFEYIY